MKTEASPTVTPLVENLGIKPVWKDKFGRTHKPAADYINMIAEALSGTGSFTRSETKEKKFALVLPSAFVVKRALAEEKRHTLDIQFESDGKDVTCHWAVITEGGETHTGTTSSTEPGALKLRIPLPAPLHLGYHKLQLALASARDPQTHLVEAERPLIVTPDKCYLPDSLATATRLWGPTVNLTGFTSNRNWGIGDFTDLKSVVSFCAAQGAGIVGVSPLHGQDPTGSELFNRQLPSHRAFLNHLYIDVEATEDFQEAEHTRRHVHSPEFQEKLKQLRQSETVDLKQVADEKLAILDRLYQQFRTNHLNRHTNRAQEFRAFQQYRGAELRTFATHQALSESLVREGSHYESWRAWPENFQDPNSEIVKDFQAANTERIEFFEYLQWQAALQLESVGHLSLNCRLPIGLLTEVSSLVSRHGAELWQHWNAFADQLYLVEPPRRYLPDGHVLDSPPFKLDSLRETSYDLFIEILQENMRHAGAIKIAGIHHWLSPLIAATETSIDSAALVEQPFDELLGIIALESMRNSCLVVADWTTLAELQGKPDSASTIKNLFESWNIMTRHDILNHEIDALENAISPDNNERRLLELAPADISPLPAFWHGQDLSYRADTGSGTEKEKRDQLIDRRVSHRVEILRLLDSKKLLPEGVTTDPASVTTMTPQLVSSIIALLSRSSAPIVLFRLEDMGMVDRPLMVYEDAGYPHWKVKMSPVFEEIIEQVAAQLVTEEFQTERGCFFDQVAVSSAIEESISHQVTIPTATYRLQLNKDFTIKDAHDLVDYLNDLGISHLYFSPLSESRRGSLHGYDVVSHNRLDPELGTQEEFDRLSADLKTKNMGIIIDVVPNHMGIGKDNSWWMDVLEHGPASEYGEYFDIDWSPVKKELNGKVLLPILGDAYGKVLTSGELKISFDPGLGKLKINYYDNELPLNPVSYPLILGRRLSVLNERLGNRNMHVMRYCSILDALASLPDRLGLTQEERERRLREFSVSIDRLKRLCKVNPTIVEFIQQNISEFDCGQQDATAYERLHEVLEKQAYRLAFWRVAAHEINYRRFFDINDLAGVRAEDNRAFMDMHSYLLRLIEEGKVQGLRIDHPDGLFDPSGYFKRIQEEVAMRLNPDDPPGPKQFRRQKEFPIYLLGEKILAPYERMEEDWLIHGTTGYDFLNAANGVLVDERNARVFTEFYQMTINEKESYRELAYRCKHLIMESSLSSELNVLAHRLSQIAESNWMYRDFTLYSLRHALSEVVAFFPVYRTYVKEGSVSNVARDYIGRAVRQAKRHNRTVHPGIFDFIHDVLTLRLSETTEKYSGLEEFQKSVLTFAMKFQQFTGPVMAKSLEDTLFYKYNRFVALNEVGGEPNHFGLSIADFHSHNEERQRTYPYSMLATSTHDTKRSEDMRARLSVLSEVPDNWQERVLRWMDYNTGRYSHKEEKRIPSINDEYLLYQTLVGTYPLSIGGAEDLTQYSGRIEGYMLKAAREAKDHTSWINQDAAYEDGITNFIKSLLKPSNATATSDPFFIDFLEFHGHISRMGLIKSLTQTLLKLTCPGVPDFYQGNEFFDFSLVDPDNRRPVDFKARRQHLASMLDFVKPQSKKTEAEFRNLIKDLLKNYKDGRLKMFVTAAILHLRKENPQLFTEGRYIPLGISGEGKDSFIAFLREYKGKVIIAVAPILVTRLISPDQRALYDGPEDTAIWQTTKLGLPKELQRRKYTNIFTGQQLEFGERRPHITQILDRFPVALLTS